MTDARLLAWLRTRWWCIVLALAMPFLVVGYGRLLAYFVDYLSPPPHRRLALFFHYLGAFLRLLLQPAFAWALLLGLLLILWRTQVWALLQRFVDRIESWELGSGGARGKMQRVVSLGEREGWTPKAHTDTTSKKDATP